MKQRGSHGVPDELKQNIAERARFLGFQLSAPSRALQFPADGQLWVEDWESSRWRGDVAMKQMTQGNQELLVIEGGRGMESWPVDIQSAPRSGNAASGGSSAL